MKHIKTERNILIIGLGFVGQANALMLLKIGFNVFGADIKNVKNIYKDRDFKEIKFLDLSKINNRNINPRFTCPVLICVNAPTMQRRPFQDLSSVKAALKIGRSLSSGPIILRTTLLPKLLSRLNFDLYMPEFLHKKYAIAECLKPKIVVLGSYRNFTKKNLPLFIKILALSKRARLLICQPQEASFIKYTSNLFNAFQITYVNELGDFIKRDGLNPSRIIDFLFQKKAYLRYGKSFDGNCLPKDIKAFTNEYGSTLLSQIIKTNKIHRMKEGKLKKFFSRS